MNDREIAGVKVFVSGETYDEYKGTLQEQIENLQSKIDKAIEYIDKHFQDDEGIICKITGEYEAERNEKFIKELLDILKEDK